MRLFDGEVEVSLPDHISSSQRVFWSCRLRWALGSAMRLKPVSESSPAMLAGHAMHLLLDDHYARKPSERREKLMLDGAQALATVEQWSREHVEKVLPRVKQMVHMFYKGYGDDGLDPATEVVVKVPVSEGVSYVGHIDATYKRGDTLVVEEWKTSLTYIDSATFTIIDPQVRDYVWAVRADEGLKVVVPVVASFLFVTPTHCSRVEVPFVGDSGSELERLAHEQRELEPLPNYGRQCRFCPYKSLCLAHLTGRPVGPIIEAEFVRGDGDGRTEAD